MSIFPLLCKAVKLDTSSNCIFHLIILEIRISLFETRVNAIPYLDWILYYCSVEKTTQTVSFFLFSHSTATINTEDFHYPVCLGFSAHIKQVSSHSVQFWCYLPGNSLRFYRLRVQSPNTDSSFPPVISPGFQNFLLTSSLASHDPVFGFN